MNKLRLEEKEGVKFFRIKPSTELNLVFTTRYKGASKGNYRSLNLSYDVGDDPRAVDKNYLLVKKALEIDKIFTLKQVHSNKVFYIDSNNFKKELEGDGLFTDEKEIAIAVKVADCLPIYVFNKKYKVIGIAHAGWRSTLVQIGKNLVNAITQKFGLRPSDLHFSFGPCIDQPCYEVGFEVLSQFFNIMPGSEIFFVQSDRPFPSREARFEYNRKIYFDLKGLNRSILIELGLTEIAGLNYCTKCNPDLFYSVRSSRVSSTKSRFNRDGTSGRNLALIYLSTK